MMGQMNLPPVVSALYLHLMFQVFKQTSDTSLHLDRSQSLMEGDQTVNYVYVSIVSFFLYV